MNETNKTNADSRYGVVLLRKGWLDRLSSVITLRITALGAHVPETPVKHEF